MVCNSAIVVFNATSGNPTGFFELSQVTKDGKVRVNGQVKGLPDGKHGLHVTFFGEQSMDCENYGPDYNAINYVSKWAAAVRSSWKVQIAHSAF